MIPCSSQAVEEQAIIRVNGKALDLNGNTPFITNGTTFIPLRIISESLGYQLDWDGINQIVNMKKDGIILELPIGKDTVRVNGKEVKISQAPLIKGKTTYVPVRFVSEQIGYEVGYKKENGKAYVDINSPAFLVPANNSEEDKFVKNYVKENKLELVKYIMSDMNNDSILDYILLVRSNVDYEDEIILVDGKSKAILAKTKVMRSIDPPTLEVKRVTGPEARQIYYYGHDGYIYEYIFDYDSGALKNIYREIEDLNNIEYNYLFGYYIDYPDLNKVICIKPTDEVLEELQFDSFYLQPEKRVDAIWYVAYIEDLNTPGEIKVSYDLRISALDMGTEAILYHTYKWVDGKWQLKDAKIKQEGNEYIAVDFQYRDANKYSSWYKNGAFNITRDNLNEIFKMSKNELIKICGKPNNIETVFYAPIDKIYNYNGFNIGYLGGNKAYPWGPDYLEIYGGNSKVLGAKVGMSPKEVKNILGRPTSEGISELDGMYILTYQLKDCIINYVANNSKGKVLSIKIEKILY